MISLEVTLQTSTSMIAQAIEVDQLVIAGWTGRDAEAVEHHVRELEELGVTRPNSTPIFYRVSTARLTTATSMEVLGVASSGEVEFVLLAWNGALWVGVGSDHTDREVETYGVTVSKQICDKPIAPVFWLLDDVVDHWDQLILRSSIGDPNDALIYQEGSVAAMLAPEDLIARYTGGSSLPDGTMMFCGTLAAVGGVRPSQIFSCQLIDPVLGRAIGHSYSIASLPILG